MRGFEGGRHGVARFLAVLVVVGCGDDVAPAATPPPDASTDGAEEATRPDAGSDDASDAGESAPPDAGSDAGDAAPPDAGSDAGEDGSCALGASPPDYPPLTEESPLCDGVIPGTTVGLAPAGAHPAYPALRGDSLPLFGTSRFSYEVPQLPNTTRTLEARDAATLKAACEYGQTTVHVAASIPPTAITSSYDCDIVLGPGASIGGLALRQSRRIRVRGGAVAGFELDESSDLTIADLVVNTGALAPDARRSALFAGRNVERLTITGVVGRAARSQADSGVGFEAWRWQHVLVANSNFVTDRDTTGDAWFASLESGANWLFVDVQAKVFRGPLLRLDTELFGQNRPLSYVVVRGGAYMHDGAPETFVNGSPGGESCLDHVYLEGTSFYLGDAANAGGALAFGETRANQLTFRWFGTDLHWFTRSCSSVNARVIAGKEALAGPDEALRYRLGSPTFADRAADFRYPDWQPIAGIADSNPERLPEL